MGARLGEWSAVYGTQATRRKLYLGKVTNWFDRIGVAEISVETSDLHRGERLMVIGPTSGVVEFDADDIRLEFDPVELAPKGSRCSVSVDPALCPDGKLRRGDKVFLWTEANEI